MATTMRARVDSFPARRSATWLTDKDCHSNSLREPPIWKVRTAIMTAWNAMTRPPLRGVAGASEERYYPCASRDVAMEDRSGYRLPIVFPFSQVGSRSGDALTLSILVGARERPRVQ